MKIKKQTQSKNAEQLLKMAGLDSDTIAELEFWGYFRAPASKGRHLAVPGGLVQHSINVTTRLVALTKALRLKWPRPGVALPGWHAARRRQGAVIHRRQDRDD